MTGLPTIILICEAVNNVEFFLSKFFLNNNSYGACFRLCVMLVLNNVSCCTNSK